MLFMFDRIGTMLRQGPMTDSTPSRGRLQPGYEYHAENAVASEKLCACLLEATEVDGAVEVEDEVVAPAA